MGYQTTVYIVKPLDNPGFQSEYTMTEGRNRHGANHYKGSDTAHPGT